MNYYTIQELAELWRCSPDVIYDMLRTGKLHGFKLGREWRVSDESRRAYEQSPRSVAPRSARRRRETVMKIQ
jgi:excisionase family DNA binding protein